VTSTTGRRDPGSADSASNRGRELPPDPAAYDDPRAVLARAKGLDAPYIPGGRDPDPETTRREERRLVRLLVAMVIVVVLAGFVLGALGMLITGAR
jgi:hypothetical protein